MAIIDKTKEILDSYDYATVYSHIDADGICAAASISHILKRKQIKHNFRFLNQITPNTKIRPKGLAIFCDLGSGQIDIIKDQVTEAIIIDHHMPIPTNEKHINHLNAHFFGIDGTSEISGAGMLYLLGRLFGLNLTKNALIGAIGDRQMSGGKLVGMNREILQELQAQGQVSITNNLLIYGRSTRPLFKSLQYFSDPYIPKVSGDEAGAAMLLKSLSIDQNKTFTELSPEQQKCLASELTKRAIAHAPPNLKQYVPLVMFGETYTFTNSGLPFTDPEEIATGLNACGKSGSPLTGVSVLNGRNSKHFLNLLANHRLQIAKAIDEALSNGIKIKQGFQYFDVQDKVKPNILGTVTSMVLGMPGTAPYVPILGITNEGDNLLKISARCSKLLSFLNIDLGNALKNASLEVGGLGGGHRCAAGAYIPINKLSHFLKKVQAYVRL
jgi:RecJ-like exonuclease